MGVSKLFDISRNSLLTYQAALNATSNNISNASNPDYSRQRITLSEEKGEYTGGISFIGSGVKLDSIQRVRDALIDTQTWSYNSKYSSAEKQAGSLSKLEALLSEPTDLGLSNLTAKFFNSWDELSVDPSSTALRNNVLNAAQNMTSKLENIYDGYTEIKKDTKVEAAQTVESINNYLSQIQTLNKEIYALSATGNSPNDLLDERGAIISELSKLSNINVTNNQDKTVSISIGGIYAVDRLYSQQFKLEEDNGKLSVVTEDGNSKMSISNGELYANLNMYNNTIPEYLKKLDTISNTIFESVNAVHVTGQTNTDPPQTNINFFSSYSNGVLEINQDIFDNPNLIAASVNGQDGNNEIALQIAALQKAKLIDGDTISNSYSNFVNGIANNLVTQNQNSESYQLVLNQLEMQTAELSGVSIDEEMVNVLKFQRSYDAAAKLIKVADELFQSLLNSF